MDLQLVINWSRAVPKRNGTETRLFSIYVTRTRNRKSEIKEDRTGTRTIQKENVSDGN